MRNKSLFLLIACVCGTIAAIGVSQWMQAQNTGQVLETVEIFVTAQAVAENEQITAEKIRLEQWPADKIPEGATKDITSLEGKYAKQTFYAGEPVLPVKLVSDKDGMIVPKGFIVVSMKADAENGITSLVRQGDRVDVNGYFQKSEVIPRTMLQTVLTGVRVFAIDGETKRSETEETKRGYTPRTISLLIRKADNEAWNYARELGKISLSLGAPGDYPDTVDDSEQSESAANFLQWLADYQAAKQAAALLAQQVEEPTPQPTPVAAPKRATFRMLKMGENGQLVEYEFTEGSLVPRIIAQTGGPSSDTASPPEPDDTSRNSGRDNPPRGDDDEYSYLSGEDSPFFQGGNQTPPAPPRNPMTSGRGTERNGGYPQ
jgi:pilus assembly protein CpaB